MRKYSIGWLCCLFFFCTGCRQQEGAGKEIRVSFSAFEKMPLQEMASGYRIVKLQDSLHLIGEVRKIRRAGNRLFILEMGQGPLISCFDIRTGKLLHVLNHYGKGPLEYKDIEDFCIDEKQGKLQLYERTGKRLIDYSLEGEYLGERLLGKYFLALERLPNGDYVTWNDEGFEFQVYDSTFSRSKCRVFEYDPARDLEVPYRLGVYRDTVWFTRGFCDDIYCYAGDQPVVYCHVDFGSHRVPDEIVKIGDMDEKLGRVVQGGYALGLCNVHFSNQNLFFSFTDMKENRIRNVVAKARKCRYIDEIICDELGGKLEVPVYSKQDTLYSLYYGEGEEAENPSVVLYRLK